MWHAAIETGGSQVTVRYSTSMSNGSHIRPACRPGDFVTNEYPGGHVKQKGQRITPLPFLYGLPRQSETSAYLISALRLAVPPSATSTSNSTFFPLAANGCQATTLCLPAGTSLISKEPSSFTTAKCGLETGRKKPCMNSCWSHCKR